MKKNSKWIHVSKALPADGEEVLVAIRYDGGYRYDLAYFAVNAETVDSYRWLCGKNIFYYFSEASRVEEIIRGVMYWQHLPALPDHKTERAVIPKSTEQRHPRIISVDR